MTDDQIQGNLAELIEEPTKPAIKSSGVIGGVLAAVGAVLQITGSEFDIAVLEGPIVQLLTAVGAVLAVFGRVKAKERIDRLL